MGKFIADLGALTIANAGTTASIIIPEDAVEISVYAPATLPETVTLYVEPTRTGTSWVSTNTNAAAGLVTTITNGGYQQLQLKAGVAVAAARTFHITCLCESGGGV